jgi:hypothetical protein
MIYYWNVMSVLTHACLAHAHGTQSGLCFHASYCIPTSATLDQTLSLFLSRWGGCDTRAFIKVYKALLSSNLLNCDST